MKEEQVEDVDKNKLSPLLVPFQRVRNEINRNWLKQKLLDLYFACPQKVQYALSKYVIKAIVNKKHSKLKDLIKH